MVFTPVFPPIDESTCDKSVVGILINFSPLLKRLAAKPLISPVIPPPIDIKQSRVDKALDILRTDIERDIRILGCRNIGEGDSNRIRRVSD